MIKGCNIEISKSKQAFQAIRDAMDGGVKVAVNYRSNNADVWTRGANCRHLSNLLFRLPRKNYASTK